MNPIIITQIVVLLSMMYILIGAGVQSIATDLPGFGAIDDLDDRPRKAVKCLIAILWPPFALYAIVLFTWTALRSVIAHVWYFIGGVGDLIGIVGRPITRFCQARFAKTKHRLNQFRDDRRFKKTSSKLPEAIVVVRKDYDQQ